MAIRHWFDRTHGKGAFRRLRSMLDDPGFVYQQIGSRFGLTRQCIAQLAKELGINARQRQRERALRREPSVIKKQYALGVQAVIEKIRRSGMRVIPYNSHLSCRPSLIRRSQTMVLVNGVAYIPVKGKYAAGSSKNPQKDWNRYEAAWRLFASKTYRKGHRVV